MKILKNGLIALMFLSSILLAACNSNSGSTGGNSSEAGDGGTMFVGLVNPPTSLNPINSGDVAAQFLEKFMFDTFLEMTEPLVFQPKLAESFETTDNQTFTIKLHPDAAWADGTPVTANDVAFTMNTVANPKTETTVGGYLVTIEGLDENGKLMNGDTEIPSLKIIDDKTIEFRTKKPVDPNMIKEQLGSKFMILPEHILGDVAPENLAKDPFMQKPTVTNGPFKFVQHKKDQYVEYEKNTDYYLGEPELDKFFVKIMPAANLVAQLQTGEIHMNAAGGIGKIAVQDFKTVQGFDNVTTETSPTIGYQVMMFNMKKITDPKVRKAMAYAINRQKIVDQLLQGNGEIVDGPYTSVNPYLNKDMENYTYDPDKAKQLLEEAGWDLSTPINLVVPIGNKVREQSADLIAQDLKAVGLNIQTTTYDFPTIMSKGKAGDFDLLLIGFTNTIDPDVSNNYSVNGAYNFMGYENPRNTELLQQGQAEADLEKRKQIYGELQEIWNEDLPSFTLYSDYDFAAVSKKVAVGEPRVFGWHYELYKWALQGAQ
ncbi:oligopeptide-binding protein AppA [Bacillaceae bacterium Marseille-Q3522]|nr:oligopeptide-binding protein AppA [Bacillaceae bacterium Marseille-Q3522]